MSGRGFPVMPCLVAALGCIALWLSFPGAAQGALLEISCPATLGVDALQRRQAPPGWQLLAPKGADYAADARLTAGGLLHGPPAEAGYLVPTESRRSRQGRRATWWQRWQLERPHWYQTFVHCDYGVGRGAPQLFRPIPEEAGECTLASSTRDGVVDQMTFVCK